MRALDPTKRRQNCTLAFKIAKNHLKVPQLIAPEDMADPNIDELSVMTYLSYFCDPAKSRLLKWVKKVLPQANITNFGTDWSDARLFGALVDTCFPGILPEWVDMVSEDGEKNARVVFGIAKKRFGIEPVFTVRELTKGDAEELKIMTFILRIKNGELRPLPEEILVSGPGILKATAGKKTQFEIDTTQAGPGRLFIDAYTERGKKVKFSLWEKLPGILTLTYMPEEAGNINFDILWSDIPIPSSPFSVKVIDSGLVKIVDFEHHERLVLVNQPIKLRLGTNAAGPGIITAQLQYGMQAPIPAKVSLQASEGTATLTYTPPKAGEPVLRVSWNGEELTHLTITYTVVDSLKYRVISKPEERVYRTFEHASFSIQSDGPLSLDVLQMTAICGDIQIPINFKTLEGNVGNATFTPTLPGNYRIEVACIDRLIEGSSFSILVADPSHCKLEGLLPKYMKLRKGHDFTIDTKDAGDGQLHLECADKPTVQLFRTNNYHVKETGRQIISVTPLEEGEFLLGIKFHGTHIPSSPFRVTVCDPTRCIVTGDVVEKKNGLLGKPLRFKIHTASSSAGIKPVVKAAGPSAKYSAEMRTSDDQTYAVQFTPWEIGTHEISITYGGFHIPKSPFLVAVTGFNSGTCSATGSGLQEALTGVPSQFVVLAKESGLLRDGTLQVRVQGVVNNVECKVRARDNNNGSYNVAFLTQIPGAYLVSVKAGGQPIPGSPFRLTSHPGPESHKCELFGPALDTNAILEIGKPIDFSVDTTAAGTGQLTVKAVGPGGAQARAFVAKANKTGLYDIKLDPVKHGKYRVSVKWSERHIPGSPFIIKVFPGADPSKCKAYGPGLEDGYVGKPSTFTIETRDAGAGTLKVRLHGVKDAFKIQIKPVDSQDVRKLQARYNPKKPGEYLVTIRWVDKHIPGSPFRVKIVGDELDDSDDERITPTPVHHDRDLGAILEEEEEEPTVRARSETEVMRAKKQRRKRRRPPKGAIIVPVPVALPPGYIDQRNMPVFNHRAMTVPYQIALIPHAVPVRGKRKKTSKTLKADSRTALSEDKQAPVPPKKMVTFSSLQQVEKHSRSHSGPGAEGPITGEYHGQATMKINTVSKATTPRSGIKKSASDSSVGSFVKRMKKY